MSEKSGFMAYFHPYRYLHSYVHNGRIGVLVEIGCESDFVIRTESFQSLANDLALQIAGMAPSDVDALLSQPFVKDNSKDVGEILRDASAKFRERIGVTRFIRWSTDDRERPEDQTPPRAPAVIMSFRRKL
jgi:elongation factor Ts